MKKILVLMMTLIGLSVNVFAIENLIEGKKSSFQNWFLIQL